MLCRTARRTLNDTGFPLKACGNNGRGKASRKDAGHCAATSRPAVKGAENSSLKYNSVALEAEI